MTSRSGATSALYTGLFPAPDGDTASVHTWTGQRKLPAAIWALPPRAEDTTAIENVAAMVTGVWVDSAVAITTSSHHEGKHPRGQDEGEVIAGQRIRSLVG